MYQFPAEPKRLLSEELKRYIEELDWDYYEDFLPPEEREESKNEDKCLRDFTELLVASKKEILSTINPESADSLVEANRDLIEVLLDKYYTLQQLENVSSLTQRTLQLSMLSAKKTPSPQTNRYISEASEAYIHGFPLAAVAMSRAALEQALKEKFGRQGDGERISLKELITDAAKWNVLSRIATNAARGLAERCNTVLHEGPVGNEAATLEILGGVRSLLEEIYTAAGHF